MRWIALIAVVVGCGGSGADTPNWPRVEDLFRVEGQTAVCSGPTSESGTETTHLCTWENVLVGGEPACWATASFTRPDAQSVWSVMVHHSSATCH